MAPGARPGPGGKFPEISPPGPAPPGAPPGAPRAPPGPGTPKGGQTGLIYICFIQERGGLGGTPPGGPPAPGGTKKCTFFWVFNNSPSRDSLGHFFGSRRDTPGPGQTPLREPWWVARSSPRRTGSAYRVTPDAVCPAERDGARGRGPSDGYPLDGRTANGWYVALGRAPPSR